MMPAKSDLPPGALNLLILKVVATGPVHGWRKINFAEAEADLTRCRALGGAPESDAEKLLLEMKGRRRSR